MLRQIEKKKVRSTSESLGTSKSGPNDKKERQGSRATRCRSVGNRVQCPYQSTSEVPRRCRKARFKYSQNQTHARLVSRRLKHDLR